MAVEQVTVLGSGPAFVRVSARDSRHCNQCALKNGCGHQLLAGAVSSQREFSSLELRIPHHDILKPGDTLGLAIDEGRLMALSLLQYGLPALAMLMAAVVSRQLVAGEGWVIAATLCALGGALALVRLIAARLPFPALLEVRDSGTGSVAGLPGQVTT